MAPAPPIVTSTIHSRRSANPSSTMDATGIPTILRRVKIAKSLCLKNPQLILLQAYCGVGGCPNGGTPERNEFGQLIVCGLGVSCPSTHECTSVTTGTSVINRCCPTRGVLIGNADSDKILAYICSLPPQQGSTCSSSASSRYYFNIVTKEWFCVFSPILVNHLSQSAPNSRTMGAVGT